MLRLAVQKSGRLSDKSIDLLHRCGIRFSHPKGRLRAVSDNFPVEILYLRDDDIPGYVEDGVADIGMVGENVVLEKGVQVETIRRLGFGRCRLAIALPKGDAYEGVTSLAGRHIATSYPRLLGDFLSKAGVEASIHEISGSVEIAPGIGLADGICDLVSTGSTLLSNGLAEVETVLKSEAVLVGSRSLSDEKKALLDRLCFRVDSVLKARGYHYVLLNAPIESVDRIAALLPGMRSPTVVPLAEEGWVSMHSVLDDDAFWTVVDQLKEAGAEGMLVVPIDKMVI
ncbi:MAG: ATP phosphoribosyltransferase [Rhodothermales bacterium]|nr:ATP phosphoribosyltransferase [Rhodothermales bacterium]